MGGTLAGVTLDLPNSSLSQEKQDKINRDNVKGLQEVMKKSGVNELFAQVVASSATSIATTDFVDLPGTPIAFVASGGYVEIDAWLTFRTSNSGVLVKLLIDSEQQDFSVQNGSSTANDGRLVLSYRGFLTPGPHTLQVQAKADSSAATYTPQTTGASWSKITGKEIIL